MIIQKGDLEHFLHVIKTTLPPHINAIIEKYHEEGRNIYKGNVLTHPSIPTCQNFELLQKTFEYIAYITCNLLYNKKLYLHCHLENKIVYSSYSGLINIEEENAPKTLFTYYLFDGKHPFILVYGGCLYIPFFIYYLLDDIYIDLVNAPINKPGDEIYVKVLKLVLEDLKNRKVQSNKVVMSFANHYQAGHYLWSEISGLDILIRTNLIKNIDILLLHEFDLCSAYKVIQEYNKNCKIISYKELETVKSGIYGFIASGFILDKTKDLYLKNTISIEPSRKLVIMIIIKADRRYLHNIEDVYTSLLNKLVENKVLVAQDTTILFEGLYRNESNEFLKNFYTRFGEKYNNIVQTIIDKIDTSFDCISLIGRHFDEIIKYYKCVNYWIGQAGSNIELIMQINKNGLMITTTEFDYGIEQQCFYVENRINQNMIYAKNMQSSNRFEDSIKVDENELYDKFEKMLLSGN
jgi:hypothetical protein